MFCSLGISWFFWEHPLGKVSDQHCPMEWEGGSHWQVTGYYWEQTQDKICQIIQYRWLVLQSPCKQLQKISFQSNIDSKCKTQELPESVPQTEFGHRSEMDEIWKSFGEQQRICQRKMPQFQKRLTELKRGLGRRTLFSSLAMGSLSMLYIEGPLLAV